MKSTKFIDLNDDCLLHIFNYLHITDLYCLGTLSNRLFHLIANHWIKYNYCYAIEITQNGGSVIEFLEMFGPYIVQMMISLNDFQYPNQSNKLFYSVTKHCSNLEILGMIIDLNDINRNAINVLSPKLSNLNGIIIENTHFFRIEIPRTLLLNAYELIYLSLNNVGVNLIDFGKFQFLIELNLQNCYINLDELDEAMKSIRHSLHHLIWKNSYLTNTIHADNILVSVLRVLNKYTKNLDSFSFECDLWCK